MRKLHGFTLIELLVVVAIIVALLAILLPSMNRAIEIAEIAVCGSNERQQITAVVSYASDFAGQLPPYRSGSAVSPVSPWNTYLAYNGNLTTKHNLANLYESYVPDPRIFYCPSGTFNKYASFSYYDLPWGEAFVSGDSSVIRTGYMYNPDSVRTVSEAATSRGVVTVDLIHFALVNQHPPTWNIGRFDGSVSSVSNVAVEQRLHYTYENGLPNPGNSWAEFNTLLDTLLRSP